MANSPVETTDLNFLGRGGLIGSFLLWGDGSAALVETGPTSTLESLTGGLKERQVAPDLVEQVFLTHIHLDHAGASGNLCELLPNATFYVHEIGAPHMIDPSKLLKSATRLYGEQMDFLWGEVRPLPEDRLVILQGGETVTAAGREVSAHYNGQRRRPPGPPGKTKNQPPEPGPHRKSSCQTSMIPVNLYLSRRYL